jgi:hypothetical protein
MMKKIILLFAVFLILGCGTRKKALDVSSIKKEVSVESDVKVSVKKDIEKETVRQSETIEIKSDISATFEGKVSDSTKPASIEERITNGSKTIIFTNFKEVKTSDKAAAAKKTAAIKDSLSIIDLSKKDIDHQESANQNLSIDQKDLAVESEKPNGWSSLAWSLIGIAVVAIGGLIFYFWNYRKRRI